MKLGKTLFKAHYFTATDYRLSFYNNDKISNFFNYKDRIPILQRTGVVYKYSCPGCSHGVYVGSTLRSLACRISAHKGLSYRTHRPLATMESSAIRDHSLSCNTPIHDNEFKILCSTQGDIELRITESLYIKKLCPDLNKDNSSCQLLIS